MPKNGIADIRNRPRGFRAAAVAAVLLAMISAGGARGQDLVDNLRKLTREVGHEYLEPAASGLGTAMNTGWFHRPPTPTPFDLSFDFGFVVVGGLYVGAPRHFETDAQFNFDREQGTPLVDAAIAAIEQTPRYQQLPESQKAALRDTLLSRVIGPDFDVHVTGPTAIGPSDSLRVQFQGTELAINVPATEPGGTGFDTTISIGPIGAGVPLEGALGDLPFLPVAAPRLTIGTFYGTSLALRYLPKVKVSEDMGKLGLFGLGLQHNLATWMPGAPVDLTLDGHWQHLEVENTLTGNTWSAGAMLSKTFGDKRLGIIPFGGVAWEKSTIDAEYDYQVELPTGSVTRTAKFTIDGDNVAHYTLGLAVQFFHVNLAGDYNFGEYDSFSGGLMIML